MACTNSWIGCVEDSLSVKWESCQEETLDNNINIPVLVLNQDYRPVNICRVRRALILIIQGKAEIVENGLGMINSVSCSVPIPSVVRLAYLVKRPRFERRLTRFEVFNRDKYTCQYCGRDVVKDLTLDHIIPRCNRHKAGRTPAEAGMKLLRRPTPPPPAGFYVPLQILRSHDEWHKFIVQAS